MTDLTATDLALLGEVARLPQLGSPVSVEALASGPATHFHMLRTRRGRGTACEALQGIVGPRTPGPDPRTKQGAGTG